MKLEFHPEAELELIEAALHYELEVPGLGERFESEVRRATDLLLDHPEIGQQVDRDLRRFVLPRFPFTLIYSATSDVLRIEVVAHQSRLQAGAAVSELDHLKEEVAYLKFWLGIVVVTDISLAG